MEKQILLLKLVLYSVLIIKWISADSCNGDDDVGNIRLLQFRQSIYLYEGVVQVCNNKWWLSWDYITTEGWTDTKAQVACRQLGFPHLTAQALYIRPSSVVARVTELRDCSECDSHLSHCLPSSIDVGWPKEWSNRVIAGLSCYCHEGSIRLVDGSTNREGRVEVCMDGRWGTVCSQPNWAAETAGYICHQLGYSQYNATSRPFARGGYGQMFTFNCTSLDPPSCTLIPLSCTNHALDIGVTCQPREDTCTTDSDADRPTPGMPVFTGELNFTEGITPTNPTADSPSVNVMTSATTEPRPIPEGTTPVTNSTAGSPSVTVMTSTTTEPSTDQSSPVTSINRNQNNTNAAAVAMTCPSVEVLGVFSGLLAAALVIVTMGWIVSCVYLQRRPSEHKKNYPHQTTDHESTPQRPLDNPVYGMNTEPQSLTNYSSLGPAYELVNADDTSGYDVVNRRGAPRPHPPLVSSGSHDPTSDQDYSVLEQDNDYHVLEATNEAREEHSGEDQAPLSEPLDYEIPTSKADTTVNT